MAKNSRKIKQEPSLRSHMIRFIGFNVCFALIPLVASVGVRYLAEITPPSGAYAQEILFFAVSVSAAALGDLMDERFTGSIRWLFELLKIVLMIVVVVSALLFGFYQYEAIIGPGNAKIRTNITPFAIVMMIATLAVSIMAESIIGYIREKGLT